MFHFKNNACLYKTNIRTLSFSRKLQSWTLKIQISTKRVYLKKIAQIILLSNIILIKNGKHCHIKTLL
jgi:hypothetical protein